MSSAGAFDAILRGRRSVRAFADRPVTADQIDELIELATWAPSAGNRQDWTFVVTTSRELIDRMAAAVTQRWDGIVEANAGSGMAQEIARYAGAFGAFAGAPAVVAVCCRTPDAAQSHLLGDLARATSGSAASAAMAAQNLMLAAHARGMGSCCLTGALAARDELARLLALGRREELVCLVTLGWPAGRPKAPPRTPAAQVTRRAR